MSKSREPSAGASAGSDQPTYRTNPEVDGKIDAYIKDNPKYWAYVQQMPRLRLERALVLQEMRQIERQQRMRDGVLKRISGNPDLKQAYDRIVKDIPEDQREAVIAQIARTAQRNAVRPSDTNRTSPESVRV